MWRYRGKPKYKCNSCQVTLLVHRVDLTAKAKRNRIVKLNLQKHRIPTLRRISLVSALTRSAIDVIIQDVISGRFSYKVGTFVVIPYLAVVQVRYFNAST